MKRLLLIPVIWLLQGPVYAQQWGTPVYPPCDQESKHDDVGCCDRCGRCGQADSAPDAEAQLPTLDPEELMARTVEYGEFCPDQCPDQRRESCLVERRPADETQPSCGCCCRRRCRPLAGLLAYWGDLFRRPSGDCGCGDYEYSHGHADVNYFWQEDNESVLKHQAWFHLPHGFEYNHRLTWFSQGSHEDLSTFDIESTLRHHFYWDCCPSPFYWALQYDDASVRSSIGRAGVGVGLHHWFPVLYCNRVHFDATAYATTDSSDAEFEFTWHVPLGCDRLYWFGWADYSVGDSDTWEVSNQVGLRVIGGLHAVAEHYYNEAWSDTSQWRGGLQWIAWFK